MDTQNHMSIRESTEEKVMSIFDAQGKASLRRTINAERAQWRKDEETKKGNARIKMEIDRIKATAPKKALEALFQIQSVLMEHQDDMPEEVYEKLNHLIANPDDDLNLFGSMTEMMAVCDYEETVIHPSKKWTTHRENGIGARLTEAEKVVRCNDPNDLTHIMCPRCLRTMTTLYYNKSHKGAFVCQRTAEAKALSLKEKKMFSLDMGTDLAKLQVQNAEDMNASLGEINTGMGSLNIVGVLRPAWANFEDK